MSKNNSVRIDFETHINEDIVWSKFDMQPKEWSVLDDLENSFHTSTKHWYKNTNLQISNILIDNNREFAIVVDPIQECYLEIFRSVKDKNLKEKMNESAIYDVGL